ncbi:hypothetical protein WJX81_005071 [Elliptochloris bilobata]|uniref:Sulfotransferase n=1 Tax=Elliptochloris bilobata TaxID=381761 RepID=A0AAW1QP54_9CHLO
MLFFLHIPRTAGRTYHACFLKVGRPPSRRCEKSYDMLRLNESAPGCGLLGSHDDFSITESLPADTAVITQLRSPVERVLSAYEFALEVAVRGVRLPGRKPPNPRKVSTREVWPWSLLVPWLEDDLRARAAAHPLPPGTAAPGANPYDSPEVAMPLAEFLEAPLVHETLHNGAALQVLGLTNYSRWVDAAALRRCAAADAGAAERLQALALERLRGLAHVGLTERLPESVASLAASLGLRMDGPAWKAALDAFTTAENGTVVQAHGDEEYLHPLPLWRTYGQCVARARKRAVYRRESSLRALWPGGEPRFDREARKRIAPAVLRRIRELNAMDEALHAAGAEMLEARLAQQRARGTLEAIPVLPQADMDAIAREPNRPGAPHRGRLRQEHARHRGPDELRRER